MADDVSSTAKPCSPVTFTVRRIACISLFCVKKLDRGFDKYKEEANTGKGLKVYPWMKWYFLIVLPLMIISIFIIELIG